MNQKVTPTGTLRPSLFTDERDGETERPRERAGEERSRVIETGQRIG